MARRKNTKFIDPRYFMDEKAERLDEAHDTGQSDTLQDDSDKIEKCKSEGGKWRYAKESKGSESKSYDLSRGLKGYCEKKKIDEGGCGDHEPAGIEVVAIEDEEVPPMEDEEDSPEGLANELLAVAQRIADMLGQEASVTSLPDEDAPMMEEKDSFSKAGEEIEKKGTEGVFTAKAKKRGMSAQEFARKVLANTDEYDLKTVRQASFAKGADTVAKKNKK
jgi:hypothetical protein